CAARRTASGRTAIRLPRGRCRPPPGRSWTGAFEVASWCFLVVRCARPSLRLSAYIGTRLLAYRTLAPRASRRCTPGLPTLARPAVAANGRLVEPSQPHFHQRAFAAQQP